MDLEKVFDEGRGVVRGAARAGDRERRRRCPQSRAKFAAEGRIGSEQARHHLRGLARLAQHGGGGGIEIGHVSLASVKIRSDWPMVSSATKS